MMSLILTTDPTGMTIADVRKYEQKLHEETNQKVLDGMDTLDSNSGT